VSTTIRLYLRTHLVLESNLMVMLVI